MSESTIQRAILDALHAAGAFAFRTNSGKVKVRGGYMNLCPPGTPDVYVLVPPHGTSLWLEIKTATGEERESQIAWSIKARARGAIVETVRGPEEALAIYLRALEASKRRGAVRSPAEAVAATERWKKL